jgi:hypothetical protein
MPGAPPVPHIGLASTGAKVVHAFSLTPALAAPYAAMVSVSAGWIIQRSSLFKEGSHESGNRYGSHHAVCLYRLRIVVFSRSSYRSTRSTGRERHSAMVHRLLRNRHCFIGIRWATSVPTCSEPVSSGNAAFNSP